MVVNIFLKIEIIMFFIEKLLIVKSKKMGGKDPYNLSYQCQKFYKQTTTQVIFYLLFSHFLLLSSTIFLLLLAHPSSSKGSLSLYGGTTPHLSNCSVQAQKYAFIWFGLITCTRV